MKRCKVRCDKAILSAPAWIEKLWPSDFPSEKWPTFCGAGNGFGDKIVPDKIHNVSISPECFIHDIGWATSADTIREFLAENWWLAVNIGAQILASELSWWLKELAVLRAWVVYFMAVSTIGIFSFDPMHAEEEKPLENAIVQERLRRLANAYYDINYTINDDVTI